MGGKGKEERGRDVRRSMEGRRGGATTKIPRFAKIRHVKDSEKINSKDHG